MKTYFLFTLILTLVCSIGCRDNSTTEPSEKDLTIAEIRESGEFLSPASGVKWARGSTQLIEWRDFYPDDKIDLILLKKKEYFPVEILFDSPNLGSFTWQIPDDIPASTYYQLKLICSNSPKNYIYSEPFTIN